MVVNEGTAFAHLDPTYRRFAALPDDERIAWIRADRWIGFDGGFVGMDSFGASAPYKDLYMKFGITSEAVVVLAEKLA